MHPNSFRARIGDRGVTHHLGSFKTAEEASQAVKDAELLFRGDDIHLNNPDWIDPDLELAAREFEELLIFDALLRPLAA
jgi:hypothetical protein